MDKVQRSGLLTLSLLLIVAGIGLIVGSRDSDTSQVSPETAATDTQEMLSVELLPPEKRRMFVNSDHFRRPPVPDPLANGGERQRAGQVPLNPVQRPPSGEGPQGGAGEEEPPAQGSGNRPARVQLAAGQTLQEVASQYLGDASLWRQIAELNRIQDPRRVPAGTWLLLPGHSSASPSGSQPEPQAETRFTVRKGQTPGHVSQEVYGTSRHWEALLRFNGIRRPQDLQAGQVLRVPPLEVLLANP